MENLAAEARSQVYSGPGVSVGPAGLRKDIFPTRRPVPDGSSMHAIRTVIFRFDETSCFNMTDTKTSLVRRIGSRANFAGKPINHTAYSSQYLVQTLASRSNSHMLRSDIDFLFFFYKDRTIT